MTPLTAVCGPHLDSTKHLFKQCSVRLERLPLKLTTDNDFQSYESISEKQSFDIVSMVWVTTYCLKILQCYLVSLRIGMENC